MRRGSGRRVLDTTDRRLCDLLGVNPRASNRALATEIGVTDETVAARLKALREEGVLATTVIVDRVAAGYPAQAMVRVHVAGRPFREAIAPLLTHPSTLAITESSGACDGVLTVIARSPSEIHHYVSEVTATLDGVESVTTDLVIDDLKIPPRILTLPIPSWDPADLPAPTLPLDDLDLALIRHLTIDGHESNSELARRLGVSDATVRRRVQRLEDGGLIEVVAAFDPVATGDLSAVAFAFCHTSGPLRPFTDAARRCPIVLAAYQTIGSSSAVLLLAAATDDELQAFIATEFRKLPSLRAVETAITSEVLVHRSHLARTRTSLMCSERRA